MTQIHLLLQSIDQQRVSPSGAGYDLRRGLEVSKDFLKKAKKNNPHQVSREGEGQYSTELWAEEAVNNIEDRANSSQPWFLQVGVGELSFFVICVPGGVLCT